MSRQKTWQPGGRAFFPLCIYIEKFKNLLVWNHWTNFNITWQKCSLGDPLPRMFKPSWYFKKHGCWGWGLFCPLYLYRKLWKYSCHKHWTDFSITWQKYSFGDPLDYQDCSSRHDTSKNMVAIGQSLFSLYIYIENFKNLLVRNHWTDFNITWQECSFGDPLPRLFKQSWVIKKHSC